MNNKQYRLFKQTLWVIFTIGVGSAITFTALENKRAPAPETKPAQAQVEKAPAPKPAPTSLIELMNIYRNDNSLPSLAENAALNTSAKIRATEIAECGPTCWDHDRPDGSSFDTAISDSFATVGENLSECSGDAKNIMESWKTSDLHNRNILGTLVQSGDWTEVGLAQVTNADYCTVTVMHFGR